MIKATQLAPHESLELHELIRSEITCMNKLQASMALVQDSELRNFMENSLATKKTTLNQYQQFYTGVGQIQ